MKSLFSIFAVGFAALAGAEPLQVAWERVEANGVFAPKGYRRAAVFQGQLYVLQPDRLVRTADGVTWSNVTKDAPGFDPHNSQLFAVSHHLVLWNFSPPALYTSQDGKTWSGPDPSFRGFIRNGSFTVQDNKVYGLGTGNPFYDKFVNGSGVTWSYSLGLEIWDRGTTVYGYRWGNCPPWSTAMGSVVAYRGAVVVLGGFEDRLLPYRAGVYACSDGEYWGTYRAYMPHTWHHSHAAIEYAHTLWLIGGKEGPQLSYTSNLENWEEDVQQPSWNTLERPSLVEFLDKVWVIGGRLRSGLVNTEIWTMRLAEGQAMPPDPGPFVVTPEYHLNIPCWPPSYDDYEPVPAGTFHTADQDRTFHISFSEILDAIMLYNWGTFHCDRQADTGYFEGTGTRECTPHASDYNPQDWRLDMGEMLRLVQLYNSPYYRPCDNGEDGFCPADERPEVAGDFK